VTRSAGAVLLASLRSDPPAWATSGLTRLDVVVLAEKHEILPLAAEVAVRHGVIPDIESGAVLAARREALSPAAVLLAARADNRARHADLDAIRELATTELARSKVGYRHLKGGALRSAGVWDDFAARPTRDVDILVADVLAIPQIEDALLGLGFERTDDVATSPAWADDHHDRPLVLGGRAGSLELHAASMVRRHRDRLVLDLPSVPGEEDLMATLRHIILHAELQDEAMLQFRLPIVALLDIAFAIEAGLVDPAELVAGITDRTARRAARVHVGLAARLRGTRMAGGRVSYGRWRASAMLFAHPRSAHLVREAAFVPRALSRSTMEAREGRALGAGALLKARWRFLRERVPLGMSGIRQTGTTAESTVPSAVAAKQAPVPEPRRGGPSLADTIRAQTGIAKTIGFEAAWSSSGLVLVDLSTDVLHHLNAPAAVVYELTGDRTLDELADSYAALAELSTNEARTVVESALDSLAQIGAVSGWSA
jgi:hypothetical protein